MIGEEEDSLEDLFVERSMIFNGGNCVSISMNFNSLPESLAEHVTVGISSSLSCESYASSLRFLVCPAGEKSTDE